MRVMVFRLLWEQEVGGSNPLAPTNLRLEKVPGSEFRVHRFRDLWALSRLAGLSHPRYCPLTSDFFCLYLTFEPLNVEPLNL